MSKNSDLSKESEQQDQATATIESISQNFTEQINLLKEKCMNTDIITILEDLQSNISSICKFMNKINKSDKAMINNNQLETLIAKIEVQLDTDLESLKYYIAKQNTEQNITL